MYIHNKSNRNYSNYSSDEIISFQNEINKINSEISAHKKKISENNVLKSRYETAQSQLQMAIDRYKTGLAGTNTNYVIKSWQEADAARLELAKNEKEKKEVDFKVQTIVAENSNIETDVANKSVLLEQLISKSKVVDVDVNGVSANVETKTSSSNDLPKETISKTPVVSTDFFAKIGISKNIALLIGGGVILFGIYMIRRKKQL